MQIVLATQNSHKAKEIQSYFQTLPIEFLSLANFPDIILEEVGKTLRENALQKARTVAMRTQSWALADDTGLFVKALGGRPGVHSARYAGENASSQQNIDKLLLEMKGLSEEKSEGEFITFLALVHPEGKEVVVKGNLKGRITQKPKGKEGFGYDPIFYLNDQGCTLAEISLEEKNKISHRAQALRRVEVILKNQLF